MATILIADDHASNRKFLFALFSHDNHKLLEAGDGKEALALARVEHPDLIVTDILLSNMDGCEFATRVRAEPAIAHTPIIFYTANYREREARALAKTCGVKWVLPKPSDARTILRTAQEALGIPTSPPPAVPYHVTTQRKEERLTTISEQLIEYLTDLEITNNMMSEAADRQQTLSAERDNLRCLAQKLSRSLSSLQAISLRLTSLVKLGFDLASERDPARLLNFFCHAAYNICVAKYAAVGILNEAGDGLRYFFTRGLDIEALARLGSLPTQSGILATLLRERIPQRLNHIDGDLQALGLPPSHPPVHSFLGVPIASSARPYGWLYLVDKLGDNGFSEADEQVAATIASQLAIAYENLSLYEEVSQINVELENRVVERTVELEARNTDLDTIAWSVSHHLQTSLRTVNNYSSILAKEHVGSLNEKGREYLTGIVNASAQMTQLIEDLLQYARLDRNNLKLPEADQAMAPDAYLLPVVGGNDTSGRSR